ncbi:MAG: TetR/AcrR family transcriptional regulator, partial [Oscillospiraceae bacterium]
MDTQQENPISIRSKKWLTDALFELMKTKPYDKISIREIALKADLTRQTFYHNFSSKDMLLMYRSDQLFSDFYGFALKNNIVAMQDLILFFFRYWQEHSDFIKLLIDNNMQHILTHRYPDYFRMVKILNVEDALTEEQQEYVYAFFSGALIYMICTWVEQGMKSTPKE